MSPIGVPGPMSPPLTAGRRPGSGPGTGPGRQLSVSEQLRAAHAQLPSGHATTSTYGGPPQSIQGHLGGQGRPAVAAMSGSQGQAPYNANGLANQMGQMNIGIAPTPPLDHQHQPRYVGSIYFH